MAKQTKSTRGLVEHAFTTLPLGSIRPEGWLSTQLRIQADGLTGHLDESWPDLADSAWSGGKGEAWERGPSCLDGLIPLAFLLGDERLKQQAQHWITSLLDHLPADGWLGPFQDANYGSPDDPWPVFVLLKAMTQYQEATGDPPGPCGQRAMYAETPGFARTETVDFVGHAAQYRTCSEQVLALRAHR